MSVLSEYSLELLFSYKSNTFAILFKNKKIKLIYVLEFCCESSNTLKFILEKTINENSSIL